MFNPVPTRLEDIFDAEPRSLRVNCKVSGIIFLAMLVCVPAHGQSVPGFAIHEPAARPSFRIDEHFSLLPRAKASSRLAFPGAQDTQRRGSEGAFQRGLKRMGRDQAEIYSAPFHRSSLKWDALFLAGTGILIASDKHTSGAVPLDHINLSRDISNVGLYGTGAVAGTLFLSSLATHNEHAREAGVLSAEAFANAFPVYAVLQLSAGRQRPNEGNGLGRFERNNALSSSFPSGHAIFTWSVATVIAHEYPRPWVQWLAYGTATAVSITRFTGREHFPADVLVGSVFGYLIGRHIFHAHCQPGLSDDCPSR
jgi:membrane-associated phospholipid phosphatase